MSPVTLVVAGFDDDRHRFDYYWPRVRELPVPAPETTLVPLERDGGELRWDTGEIVAFMEDNGFRRAFVRTQHKAAVLRPREGSFVHRPDPEVIDRTVRSLLDQLEGLVWSHGGGLVVREWLDLDFCRHPNHACHPSVRYFVDDGEVVGRTPAPDVDADPSFACADSYDYLEPTLEAADPEAPRPYAEEIAAALPEVPWAVDFAMDTAGDWYWIECNLDGVYWNRREEAWWNMAGQGDREPFGPVQIHSAALWGVRPDVDPGYDTG